ncbi:hypothetical protein ACIQU5_36685 [Streptomyces sp. NPDC090306]|uniref:hypothetical protein n=1 Tax=Streptomyces sp. NPDC090306 TaxID=3365961 RepID=UPI00380B0966
MTDRLPILSAQLGFALMAERTGRRIAVPMLFRMPLSLPSAVDLDLVLQSITLRNPALCCRIRFDRGGAYQERHSAEFDFAELQAENEVAAKRRAVEAIDEFEASLDGAPMSARLIRSLDGDYLLLVFDHALIDEQSLLQIRRQLGAPSFPDDRQWERFEAAVHDRAAFEAAAAAGPGIAFWADRLKSISGEVPTGTHETPKVVPVIDLPGVTIPSAFRGSCFPYVLLSIHRALRDVSEFGPTLIGYPWGGRNATFSDVVGCFMNTVISLDMTGSRSLPGAMADFLDGWYAEIDHADVPFASVAALGSAFSGSVDGLLTYTHALESSVNIAGTQVVEISPGFAHSQPISTFIATAMVCDDELRLELIMDEETAGYGAQELGSRWRHRLSEALSGLPAWQS